MRRIIFISRSYLPDITGGTLVRAGSVKHLQDQGYQVTVITPNYRGENIIKEGNTIYIPLKSNKLLLRSMEHLGIIEDYLDLWVKDAFNYLATYVKKEDLVLATSGGELGCIKLACMLKKHIGCKAIVNFHDPLDYSRVYGDKINKIFHVSREEQERKYLSEIDLIITSSDYYRMALMNKYPEFGLKIKNNYFGYTKEIDCVKPTVSEKLRIGYGGALGLAQSPWLLHEVAKGIPGVEVIIIGDPKRLHKLEKKYPQGSFVPHMESDKYVNFVQQKIDVGFVSLVGDYFASCVPSKIYEFINMCKPILAALPNGDAKEIINTNGFGIACYYKDYQGLKKAIVDLSDPIYRNEIIKNMREQKEAWPMSERIKEVDMWLREL